MNYKSDKIRFLVKEQVTQYFQDKLLHESTGGGVTGSPFEHFLARARATPREMQQTVDTYRRNVAHVFGNEARKTKVALDALPDTIVDPTSGSTVPHPEKFHFEPFDPDIHVPGFERFDPHRHIPGYVPFDPIARYDEIVDTATSFPLLNKGHVDSSGRPTRKVDFQVRSEKAAHDDMLKKAEKAHYGKFDLRAAQKHHDEEQNRAERTHVMTKTEDRLSAQPNHPIHALRRQLEREEDYLRLAISPLNDPSTPASFRIARTLGDVAAGALNPWSGRRRPVAGHVGAVIGRGLYNANYDRTLGPGGEGIGSPAGDLESRQGPS